VLIIGCRLSFCVRRAWRTTLGKNGTETCDPTLDCQAGTLVDCGDGNNCTDDACNEDEDSCDNLCNATGPEDPCCGDSACEGDPICVPDCIDNDGDGYGDPASAACTHPELNCDDGNPSVNPGATEVCGNGIDDNCNGLADEGCGGGYSAAANAEAAVFGSNSVHVSGAFNEFVLFIFPACAIVFLRTIRRKKRK